MTLPAFLLALFLLLPGPADQAQPATAKPAVSALPAVAAEPIERTLEPGEVHPYDIEVDAPTLLVVQVEQRGVNAAMSLTGPEGHELAAVAGPGGPWSEEILAAVLAQPGDYRVQVTTDPAERHAGRYHLRTVELRRAGENDVERVSAEQLFSTALQEGELPDGGEDAKERSISMLRTVSASFERLGERRRHADALHELGATLLEVSRLETAITALQQERTLRRDLGDAGGEASALEGIARVLTRRSDFAAAMEAIGEAGELAAASGDAGLQATVDNTLGYVHFQQQDYARAIAPFQRAVSGHRRAGNAREEAIGLMNLGQALRTTGDETKRCSAIEESARLLESLRYPSPLAFLYLGDCRQKQGRIAAAVGAYERALEQARATGDSVRVSLALLYSAGLLAQLGEYEQARRRIEEARDALAGGGSTDLSAHLELHLGWLDLAQGDPATALQRFETALSRLSQSGEGVYQRSVASAQRAVGDALIELGRPGEAVGHLERAVAMSRDAAERRPAEALRKLGVAYMELGDLENARRYLDQALSEVGEDLAQEGATHSRLARLALRQGRLGDALAEVETAIDIRESVRATVAPPSVRASYLARWRADYGLAIDLLLALAGQADGSGRRQLVAKALAMSERAHSRTLQELLVEARSRVHTEVPAELALRQRRGEERMTQLNHRLTSGQLSAEEEEEVGWQLEQTADELMQIEWKIRSHAFAAEAAPTFRLATLQAELQPKEALLEYFLGEEASHLFVVTRQGLSVHTLGPSDETTRLVELTRSGLVAEQRHLWPRLIEVSRDLYGRLIAPAENDLTDIERLIVVPDQELFYLPFEVLLRETPPRPYSADAVASRYLVGRWEVGYVPSATVLGQLRTPSAAADTAGTGSRKMLVAFADPTDNGGPPTGDPSSDPGTQGRGGGRRWYGQLPGARAEVASIAGLMSADEVSVFLGDQATEDRLTTYRQPTRWYHFAVHGILNQRHPSLSGLVLADGELQVHEIYDLDLDAELVVLSACETGLGQTISGEELIGLSRAFFYAGVPTVVVSLWRVADSSTASLMVLFYRRLLAGDDPVSALAEAKRRLMTDTEWQHPYHWAPFIVLGNPHPVADGNARLPDTPSRVQSIHATGPTSSGGTP